MPYFGLLIMSALSGGSRISQRRWQPEGRGWVLTYYLPPANEVYEGYFLHVSVCPQRGSTWGGTPGQVLPLGRSTPWEGTPPTGQVQPPLGRYTSGQVHPPGRYPRAGTHPGSSACWKIRATSGRYASYWNGFLFGLIFAENCMKIKKKLD